MFRTAYALAALIAVAGLTLRAQAVEFCVTCAGPEATYRCIIPELAGPAAEDPRARLTCIKEMAAAGGHESCSVRRVVQGPCQGPIATVALPSGAVTPDVPVSEDARAVPAEPPPGPAAQPLPPSPPVPPSQNVAEPLPPAPPGTTVIEKTTEPVHEPAPAVKTNLDKAGEAVSKVAKSAGRQLEKAGAAVGGAAKKTWDCMSSLFQDC